MQERISPAVRAYGVAVAASALAALTAWLLGPVIEPTYLPPFLAAVTLSAWYGGWRAGLLATALCSLAIDYFYIPPYFSLAVDAHAAGRILLFVAVAVLIVWLVAQLQTARRQAETRLRQVEGSQRWLEALLDLMPTPLLLIEPGTARVTFANRAATALGGALPPLSRLYGGLTPAAQYTDATGAPLPEAELPCERAARGEQLDDYQLDWRSADGEQRTLTVSSATLPAMYGHPATVIMPFRDISPLKRAEGELERRICLLLGIEELGAAITAAQNLDSIYRLTLDCIRTTLHTDRAAILLQDDRGVMRFQAWHGLSEGYRSHAEGHSPWPPDVTDPQPVLTPDVLDDPTLAPLHATITGEGIRALGFIPLVANNRLVGKFMLYYNQPHQFTSVEVQAAQTIARHVAFAVERVRAEEALRTSEERLRLAARATNDAIWDWDLRTDRIEWNEATFTSFGYAPAEVPPVVTWWSDHIHPDDRERVVAGIHAVIDGDVQHWRDEYRFQRGDGSYALVIDRGYVLRDAAGRALRMIGAMQDITERKEAEERLQELNQQLVVATLWAQELAKEAEASERRAAFLAEASSVLAGSLDAAATLQQVARLAAPALADCAIVDLLEPDGSIARVAVVYVRQGQRDPEIEAQVLHYAPTPAMESHPVVRVLRSGHSILLPDISDEQLDRIAVNAHHREQLRRLGLRSSIIAPLVARGRTAGAITLVAAESGRRYTQEDVKLAEDLARRAALAVDNARLYQEAQEAIQRKGEALALLDTLLTAAPVGFAFNDREHRFVRVNETLAAINGRPVAEHLGRTLREVLPDSGPEIEAIHRRVMETGEPLVNQERTGTTPAAPGDQRHWLTSYYPVRAGDGQVLGVGVVTLDITERKRNEEESDRLHRETEQIAAERAAILEQMPSGVIVFNARGEAMLVNQAARRILDGFVDFSQPVPPQMRLYQPLRSGNGEPLPLDRVPISRTLAGETVHAEEFAFRRPGERRDVWLQVSAVPLRDSAGRITGGVTVFEDITVRKTLEQLKDEFLSLAAHELKTPLATIKGNSQLLLFRRQRGRLSLPEADAETLRIINEKADYMASLIDELLDLSRAETGRLALHPEPMDLAALLERLAAQQRQLHPNTPFLLEGTEQPVTGTWDRGRLEQVFTNLLDNAVKYSSPGRPVHVRLSVQGNDVQVAVRDEGIGIPAEEQPHIFERHFRAGNAGLSRSGLGLGLYLSRQIVERHGGRIAAESAEGRGSTFTVTLPLSGAPSAAREQAA